MIHTNRLLRGFNIQENCAYRKINQILIDVIHHHVEEGAVGELDFAIELDIEIMNDLNEYARENFYEFNSMQANAKDKAKALCRKWLSNNECYTISPAKIAATYGIQAMFKIGSPIEITQEDIDKNFKDWVSFIERSKEAIAVNC